MPALPLVETDVVPNNNAEETTRKCRLVPLLSWNSRDSQCTDNDQVTLHLEGDGHGGAIVVLNGTAVVDKTMQPVTSHPEFLAKYQTYFDKYGWSAQDFTKGYPTPIRVTITTVRG